MKTFPEKVRDARISAGLSQTKLAKEVGVSSRSIQCYERGEKKPRQTILAKLAKTLNVLVKFLSDDTCENPIADIEKDNYIAAARERFSSSGANEMDRLLDDSVALFAGGDFSQSEKDVFFQALMTAYVTCREEARQKFSSKSTQSPINGTGKTK